MEATLGIINSIMLLFVVLGLGAAAGFFCERVGIVNIGIDGQMIYGALFFSIFGLMLNEDGMDKGLWFLVPLLLSILFSSLMSLLFGYLVIKVQADHVVIGTALNLISAGLATFLTKPLGESISNGAWPKLRAEFLPELILGQSETGSNLPLTGETIIILVLAIITLTLASLYLWKSRFGLRFKAIGDNPNAVDAQGISVNKYKWIAILISGAFAAAAGSIFIYGGATVYPQSFYFEGNVSGLGFLALAIVIAGIWRLPFVSIAALGFAILSIVFNRVILNKDNYIDKIWEAVPFMLSLVTLIAFSWKGVAPKALGKHFNKSTR